MLEVVAPPLLVLAVLGYLLGVNRLGPHAWPRHRTGLWLAGLIAAGAATLGPLAEAGHHEFRAHMVGHLLLGMAAPLLLVRAAPVTLLLRALPVVAARRVSRVLRWPVVRWLTEPLVAATLNLGGLWILYRTDLFALTQHHALGHVAVHIHVLVAGCLFTTAVVGVDPNPHRRSFTHRGVVLVLAVAAHAVLAKSIYADPPAGVDAAAARSAGMIMYYGGDVVELAMIIVLWADWYRRRGRVGEGVLSGASSSRARSRSASRSPAPHPGRSTP